MIKTFLNSLKGKELKAKVYFFKDDKDIRVQFEDNNYKFYLDIFNVEINESTNFLNVGIFNNKGKSHLIYLANIKFLRNSCVTDLVVYEAKLGVNCMCLESLVNDEEIIAIIKNKFSKNTF